MDVFFVCFREFSCIQPYLVNQLVATFNSLRIDVFCFVVVCFINIWISICFTIFISQLSIIIKKFVISDRVFLCIQYILLWLELRFSWRCYGIVKFFISSVCYVSNDCFSCTIMRYHNFHSRNHWVVRNSAISTTNFFYSVIVCLTKIITSELKSLEVNLTRLIVLHCFDNIAIFLKNECEFLILQLTTFKRFREFKIKWNWNIVYTFFSWFVWSFNLLSSWIVVVNNLSRSIFNICTSRNISFHCCWDVELVVTSEGEFSCVNDLSVFCVAK